MRKANISLLIILALLVIGSTFYLNTRERPQVRVLSSADSNSGTLPGANLVAFVSDRDGNNEIYLTDEDFSFFTRVTETLPEESLPAFSDSAHQLAFLSQDGDLFSIWLFSVDRKEKQLLSITRGIPKDLKFSPDGQWLTLLEDSSEKEESNDLFVINTQDGKTERVASKVENFQWSSDSKTIIYTQKNPQSIVQTKIEARNISADEKLAQASELFTGGTAPVFLSRSKEVLFLDVTKEFLRLVSMSLRGENQKELFKIRIRPQEKTKYTMQLSPLEDQIILQIFSEQFLLESLIISLKEQSVKTLDLKASKLKWGKEGRIIYNMKDQTGNLQLWVREQPEADAYQITTIGNNWL